MTFMPSTGSSSFTVEMIEQQSKPDGVPAPITAAEPSSFGVRRVVPAPLTESLDQQIHIHQKPSWRLELPANAVAMRAR